MGPPHGQPGPHMLTAPAPGHSARELWQNPLRKPLHEGGTENGPGRRWPFEMPGTMPGTIPAVHDSHDRKGRSYVPPPTILGGPPDNRGSASYSPPPTTFNCQRSTVGLQPPLGSHNVQKFDGGHAAYSSPPGRMSMGLNGYSNHAAPPTNLGAAPPTNLGAAPPTNLGSRQAVGFLMH